MSADWPQSRPYVIGSLANWLLFLATLYLLARLSGPDGWPAPALWAIAVLHASSVAGQFYVAYRLIARQDEYIRGITIKRMIAAAGGTITAAVFWGVAQQFLGASSVPLWIVYPLFWGVFGMVTPLIRTSLP